MTRRRALLFLCGWGSLLAQRGMHHPPANARKIELKGRIERVSIVPGQGMPYLELRDRSGVRKILLGSMRYLIEQDFHPKAGVEAVVRGFDTPEAILAIRIEIPSQKISIRLRDENGMPVWRGGWGPRR